MVTDVLRFIGLTHGGITQCLNGLSIFIGGIQHTYNVTERNYTSQQDTNDNIVVPSILG